MSEPANHPDAPPTLSYATPLESPPAPPWWMWLAATPVFMSCASASVMMVRASYYLGSIAAGLMGTLMLVMLLSEWLFLRRRNLALGSFVLLLLGLATAAYGIGAAVELISAADAVVHHREARLKHAWSLMLLPPLTLGIFIAHARFVLQIDHWQKTKRSG
jgi:hypothetical protein